MQKIIPAILTADPAELRDKLELLKGNSSWVHIDIMDGKFVPNSSINLFELGEAYQFFNLEIHLMVEHPEKYFEDCSAIAAKRVVYHWEALQNVPKQDFQTGVAINPETPIPHFTEKPDSLLIMGVHPGFQGQAFVPEVLAKIKQAPADVLVGVDGGMNAEHIKQAFELGADYAVVGSSIWKSPDPMATFKEFNESV
jgi:ribulose-phosphate 3-epimerase